MPEISFDLGSLTAAIQHAMGTGMANALGECIAQGISEHLEMYLRTLSREAAQAAPTRDQLAAMAMQALAAPEMSIRTSDLECATRLARRAYVIADAMLAERAKALESKP